MDWYEESIVGLLHFNSRIQIYLLIILCFMKIFKTYCF